MTPAQPLIAVTLAILASTSAGGQTLQPIDQLAVADANGKTVGKFIELWQGDAALAAVALKMNDLIFEVWVGQNAISSTPSGNDNSLVSFESTDCSGQAFLFERFTPESSPLGGAINVAVAGYTIYVPAGPPQSITVMSQLDSTTGTCTRLQSPFSDTEAPLQASDALFTPPFRLTSTSGSTSAAQCCGDCNGNGQVTVDELVTSVNYALNGCPAS